MNKQQKEVLQVQLNREKELLRDLRLVYGQAQDDTVNKVIDLSRRKDMENLQTIIFQKQYQDVLRTQIDAALDKLQNESYNTIQEYLEDCYANGFIGAFYDIAGQGIPLIAPINHEAVVKAIQIDSKLSTRKVHKNDEGKNVALYEKMGEDINDLKKTIRMEVSRGVLNGSSWNDIGKEIADSMKSTTKGFGFNKALNNATRIARTEGHRVQAESALDAQKEAKKKGADVLKQWDATLDGLTREAHRIADGQIRELDEPFDVGGEKLDAPGVGGSAANVCNCRCALLQRARWALDQEELATLRERAAYHGALVNDSKAFGHEKAKDFADYKEKYLKLTEAEKAYYKAIALEPEITKVMQDIAEKLGVNLYGLENRIKSKESFFEKVRKNSYGYEVKDIIRYTFGTDESSEYVKNYHLIIAKMEEKGYNILEIKNYWLNDDDPYNGINSTVIEHKGQKFEVQFHTKESFEAKQEMHSLYEQQRKIKDKYSHEYIELTDKMLEIADRIVIPKGVRGL